MPGFSELILLSERLRDELFQARGTRVRYGLEGETPTYTGWEGADLKGIQDQRYNQDDIPISLIYLTIKICIWICISHFCPFFLTLGNSFLRMQSIRKDSHGGTLCLWQNCGNCQGIILQSSGCHDHTLNTISTPQWKILASRFCLQSYSLIYSKGFTISQDHLEVSYPIYLFKVKKPEVFSHLRHEPWDPQSPKLSAQSITGMTTDLKLFPSDLPICANWEEVKVLLRRWVKEYHDYWAWLKLHAFSKVVSVRLGWQDLERMEENKRRYINMTG